MSRERTKLTERIEYLEQREEGLLRETHELREQNELLEFRIIELEESHDKVSSRTGWKEEVCVQDRLELS